MKKETVYTFTTLNWFLFIIGIIIVWLASHNWIAVLGAIVASVHLKIKAEKIKNNFPDYQLNKNKKDLSKLN